MANGTKSPTNGADEHFPLLNRDQDDVENRNAAPVEPSTQHIEHEWDAEENRDNPQNWASWFKWATVLGFGLGPLLFAPLSELYGRAPVYRSSLLAFMVMTIGCGLSQNIEILVAFRFLAGCFGASPVAIGGAVVGDLFPVKERGAAMSIYQAGQIISAVVGPPIGGLIGSYLIWRWVFWIVCMLVCCDCLHVSQHSLTIFFNRPLSR